MAIIAEGRLPCGAYARIHDDRLPKTPEENEAAWANFWRVVHAQLREDLENGISYDELEALIKGANERARNASKTLVYNEELLAECRRRITHPKAEKDGLCV